MDPPDYSSIILSCNLQTTTQFLLSLKQDVANSFIPDDDVQHSFNDFSYIKKKGRWK